MTEFPALADLLQRALDHQGVAAAPHPDSLRDWLWLADQLEGMAWAPATLHPPSFPDEEPPAPFIEAEPATSAANLPPPSATPAPGGPPAPWLPTPFPDDPPAPQRPSERLARLTDPNLLPDGASLAEALPLQLTELPLLPRPERLLKAMKPLLQKRSHPRWQVLDEERSAVSSHERGMPWPEFRPRKVPLLALRIVLDAGLPMLVWDPLARELQRVLASSQAFARVDLVRLDLAGLPTRLRGGAADAEPIATLLLSDTAGAQWWDGSLLTWLRNQGTAQPLLVLHLLPPRYWEATALQRAEAVTLLNRVALAGNQRYEFLRPLLYPWEEAQAHHQPAVPTLPVPVISLDHRELASWAALVTGEGLARCSGRLIPLQAAAPPAPAAGEPLASPEAVQDLWEVFVQRASPAARQLLLAMATSPLLTLPMLRLLLATVAPDGFSPQPLAEVLRSGLVRRLPHEDDATAPLEQIQFEVLPELQALLQDKLDARLRRQVLDEVTALLQRHWDCHHAGPSFRTLVFGPKDDLQRNHPDLHHIAHLTAAMLDRLPGREFQELAAQLRGVAVDPPLPPLWPAAMAFKQKPFETAQLVDTPALELLTVTAARWQEFPLQPIAFPTLRPADLDRFLREVDREGGEAARASLPTATALAFHEPLRREGLAFGATAERPDPLALTLVEIPAGSFQMGSPRDEPERAADEGPQHEVTLERFFLSQTPITQAQWREVAGWQPLPAERWGRELDPEPSYFQSRRNPKAVGYFEARFSLLPGEASSDLRPVENVSWEEAIEFCNRLSQRTGRSYSLPSEAQWEYACRAESSTPFAFGKTLSPELANYDGNFTYANGPNGKCRQQTTPVAMFPANAWGLQDMHGNLREWCLDHWHENYEGAPIDGSPWLNAVAQEGQRSAQQQTDGTNESERRLLRGGSWLSDPRDCRSAYRNHYRPDYAFYLVGFRVLCLPQGPSLNS